MEALYWEKLKSLYQAKRTTYRAINIENHLVMFFYKPELQVKKDTKKKDWGQGVTITVGKVATEAAIVDTLQGLCMGEAAFSEGTADKDNLNPVMVDSKESVKVKVDNKKTDQVKVVKKELDQIKAASKDEEICGPSKVDDLSSNIAGKVSRGENCKILKEKGTEKKKKRGRERSYEAYKGFEKVVKDEEPAGEAVQGKESFDQSKVDCEEFNQVEKVDVTDKKRGREKFDREFARNSRLVGNLIKKVEKNNKKMEKLGRNKEGFVPVVSEGEQWFDAKSDLASESYEERQGCVETVQGDCARGEVKKAEVE